MDSTLSSDNLHTSAIIVDESICGSSPRDSSIFILSEYKPVENEQCVNSSCKEQSGNLSLYTFNVYSNVYFKNKKTLVGILKNLTEVVQTDNNTLVFKCNNSICDYSQYMPIFKCMIEKFQGLLLNVQQGCSLYGCFPDISPVVVIKSSLSEDNMSAVTVLDVNTNLNLSKKPCKEFYQVPSVLVNKHVLPKTRRVLNVDLDEISPVDEQDVTASLEDADQKVTDQNETRVVLLEPLLLESLRKDSWEKKLRIEESEYKKSIRIVIMYTFAFCGLAITTFFIIYLA